MSKVIGSTMKISLLAGLAAIVLGACTAVPIYNVNDAPVVSATGKPHPASEVRKAIMSAGVALGWTMADARPGVLEGTLRLREHVAVVEIPYSATKFSIVYKSGENLKAADGTIHKNYNGWIHNLEAKIRSDLARA